MPENAFIKYLCSLVSTGNRAALAQLRRGLGKPPGSAPETYPIVVPWLGDRPSTHQDAMFLVASLFAMHPLHADGMRSLGQTLRIVAKKAGDDASTERRFTVLLNAHIDDLPNHMRQIISLAASKDAPVNYERLLDDLAKWNYAGRPVQRRWASDFWGTLSSGPVENESKEPPVADEAITSSVKEA